MKDEIKEINIKFPGQILDYVDTKEHLLELFNYITNLQEENERLKQLCDKYEEEHSTTFEYWKQLVKEDYKSKYNKVLELLNRHDIDTGDIYYKYNNRFVKSELKERIREIK